MTRNPYLDVVHALRAGYTLWQVIPLLSKLPDGFLVDNPDGGFAQSTRIEWQHPSKNWDCRHFIDIMRKDKFDPDEYKKAITDLIFVLEAWATEPRPDRNAFELHHDRMESQGHNRKAIAEAWYDQLPPSERRRLSDDHLGKDGAIRKLVKDIDNLRRKRNNRS